MNQSGQPVATGVQANLAGLHTPGPFHWRDEGRDMADKKAEYAQKLKDPRWQKQRLRIMERDEFTCQMCMDKDSPLNVHHRYYVWGKEPWSYPDEALVTLCEKCHEGESSTIKDYSADLLLVLKHGGAMSDEFARLITAFIKTHDTRLVNADWAVLTDAIGRLLDSHRGDRALWAIAESAYYEGISAGQNDQA